MNSTPNIHHPSPYTQCHGKETIATSTTEKYNLDILPLTREASIEVALNLREDDRREVVEGHGKHPLSSAIAASLQPNSVYFTVPNGRIAGMGGVADGGLIWMLCTPAIHDYPILFARAAKRYLDSIDEPILWNIVDKRNTVHIKLLKFLGFKFLRELTYGPNNITFIEFCKCVNPQQQS